jgi:rhomboid protease GluP
VSGFLGVLDPEAVIGDGEVWRLMTSLFLHAGILHIAFNMSWLRSIGPLLEEEFGAFRFACLYLGSGLVGSLACLAFNEGALGASGAVFGLIGAGWAHGKRRGGVWGAEIRAQFGRWAVIGVVFTAIMSQSGVSVPGHIGGLI